MVRASFTDFPAHRFAEALLVDVDPRARWADALLSAPRRDDG